MAQNSRSVACLAQTAIPAFFAGLLAVGTNTQTFPVYKKIAAADELVGYSLSTTLDGPEWGDGTGGSMTYDATATGFTQNVTVYGRVPAQLTPTPGDDSDRITATIYF